MFKKPNITQNTFTLKRPRVANFADIIKIVTILAKQSLNIGNISSKKKLKIGNYVSNYNLYLYFLI